MPQVVCGSVRLSRYTVGGMSWFLFCNCRLLYIPKRPLEYYNLLIVMDRKIKYICFHTKENVDLYEGRTRSPYKYPKCRKSTVRVRKVKCTYEKIITKNCRINDLLKFMDSDLLFPMNSTDYCDLLVEVSNNSISFFDSLSKMSENDVGSKMLRLAYSPIQESYTIIYLLIVNEVEGTFSADIKRQAKTLRFNLWACIKVLENINSIPEDGIVAQVVEDLETYISNLRTVCNFIYLIVLKRKSSEVHKILPTVPFSSSKVHICSICAQVEVECGCLDDLEENYQN